jgi:hypothetical protein
MSRIYHLASHHSKHPNMVSTVMLEPLTTTSIPEGTKTVVPIKPNRQEHRDAHGELSTSHAPTEVGGSDNNPPRVPIPQVHEGMAYEGNRVARPVHPTTRITSSTTSETATVKPWIYVTPALRKPAHEKCAYLASGEESDKNSVYTPWNHGSKTPSHGSPSRTEMTPATDEPKSTDIGYTALRCKRSEVTMSLEDREDCCWAKYRVQREVRWAQI